jgi:hypothetical protein
MYKLNVSVHQGPQRSHTQTRSNSITAPNLDGASLPDCLNQHTIATSDLHGRLDRITAVAARELEVTSNCQDEI